jgi:hypothetical protein
MVRANANDRASLEAAYPLAAHAEDSAANAVGATQIVHGVRIVSAADPDGWFQLARAQHHVGELTDAVRETFLAPSEPSVAANLVGAESEDAAPHGGALAGERRRSYEAFLDRLAQAARSVTIPEAIGRGEDRLRGYHGG